MKKKISFVVPAYNSQDFIKQCVNSILSIPYDNFEVIVVNDGSTDATADVLAGIDDSRLKVINQQNSGVSAARNCGIANASGEYIAFSDADDEILPQEFGRMLQAIDFDKDMYMYAYEKCLGSKIKQVPLPLEPGVYGAKEAEQLRLRLFDEKFSDNYNSCYFGGKIYQYLFKKSFITENNISFFEDISFAEDCLFCFACFNAAENFEVVDFCPYRFIIYGGSASHSYRRDFWQELKTAYERACKIAGCEVNEHKNELYIAYGREVFRRCALHCGKSITKSEALEKINEVLCDSEFVNAVSNTAYEKWTRQEKLFINLCRKKKAGVILTAGRLKNLLK